MQGKTALVDYRKCDPERCDSGVCLAVAACPRRLIAQEAPYEVPMADPFPCKGCGDCAKACPVKAIEIVVK
jgi:translation initiation factor RLI1